MKTQTIKIAIGTTAYVVGVFALFASPFFALWAFADYGFSIQYSAFGIIAFGGFLLSVFGYKVIKL